jgi:hypothetical protein
MRSAPAMILMMAGADVAAIMLFNWLKQLTLVQP